MASGASGSAAELKERGNAALQRGDLDGAEAAYAQGVVGARAALAGARARGEVTAAAAEELAVLLSNRVAALLRRAREGDAEAALADAYECTRLRPLWGKAYGRLGAALFAVGRYADALEAYEEGQAVDRANEALREGVAKCRAAVLEHGEGPRGGDPEPALAPEDAQHQHQHQQEAEQDPLASFLADISGLDESAKAKEQDQALEEAAVLQAPREKAFVVDHEAETKGWTAESETERLTQPRAEWLNCNPYYVLGLGDERATDDDVRQRYLRLSALVHPDKNPHLRAQDAFMEVKKAYERLSNLDQRALVSELISGVKQRVRRTRARLRAKGLTERELEERDGSEAASVDKELKREFAQREHQRQRAELNHRAHEKRDAEAAQETAEYWRSVKAVEETMREGRDERASQWQGFAKNQGAKRRKT
jgi:hypothetical protein